MELIVAEILDRKDATAGAACCGVVSGSNADNVARNPLTEGSSGGIISSAPVVSAVMAAVFLVRHTDAK